MLPWEPLHGLNKIKALAIKTRRVQAPKLQPDAESLLRVARDEKVGDLVMLLSLNIEE